MSYERKEGGARVLWSDRHVEKLVYSGRRWVIVKRTRPQVVGCRWSEFVATCCVPQRARPVRRVRK